MKTTLVTGLAATALVLGTSGCGLGGTTPAPEPATTTVTETAKPEPAPEPVTETVTETAEPAPQPTPDQEAMDELAWAMMQETWDEQSPSEQEDMCFGWRLDSEWALDSIMAGSGDAVPRADMKAFFDEKCL